MRQLTLAVPDDLAQRLDRLAAEQEKSVEQVALDLLVNEQPAESPEEQYQRRLDALGLFVKIPEEEKQKYPPISEERRQELADKLGAAGPLSQVIIDERGPR